MGEKYKIIVSEPWGYRDVQGKNIIIGEVLKAISTKCIVFISDDQLRFDSDQGNVLILSGRYEKKGRPITNLDGLIVNGGLLLGGYDDAYNEEVLKERCKFVIIGGLEKL